MGGHHVGVVDKAAGGQHHSAQRANKAGLGGALLDGRSLAPLVRAGGADAAAWTARPAFTEVQHRDVRGVSMRSGRWRYTVWNGGEAGRQLYDHNTDPHEFVNLADRPDHAATVQALDAEMRWFTPQVSAVP